MQGLSSEEVQQLIDSLGGDSMSDNAAYQVWFAAADRDDAMQRLTVAMGRQPVFTGSPE